MATQTTLNEKYNILLGEMRDAESKGDKGAIDEVDKKLTRTWMKINKLSTIQKSF